MKKPARDAPPHIQARYRTWVQNQLKDWDPRDDHHPGTYAPRYDGVRGDAVEYVEAPHVPSVDEG